MIQVDDFVTKWNGTYVEVAGTSARNQCVDLANLYIRDVLHFPIIEWTNAKDFPSKGGNNYTWIANTPTGVPEEGDLVVWGGTYGHIAIFIEGDVNSFRSFDQNYPTGSPCHIQNHNYTSPQVLGWMRPKVTQPATCDPQWRIERDTNWNLYLKEQEKVSALQSEIQEARIKYEGLTGKIRQIKDIVSTVT